MVVIFKSEDDSAPKADFVFLHDIDFEVFPPAQKDLVAELDTLLPKGTRVIE